MNQGVSLQHDLSLWTKFLHLNWGLIVLICCVSGVGFLSLYSAAGGAMMPWAMPHLVRFGVSFIMMIVVALIGLRFWYKMVWPIYGLGMALLLYVEIMGQVGMGAQRWINLGFMNLQPSELMKIAVIMALAKMFHSAGLEDMRRLKFLMLPALVILAPVGLVLLQPDLGTALMILIGGGGMFFVAGAPLWLFGTLFALAAVSLPLFWQFFLHDYQKQRVLTFLNPESDPLGAGYHIMQSKIALGSGGIDGKGFLQGTQSRLNFLPEKQTDFIFTLWAEEWGLTGGIALLILFSLVLFYGIWIAMRCRHNFGRFLGIGLSINFSLYIFINISMVMGLIPVVGAPLPLISYGGTAMLAAMAGFGLMMSCSLHKDAKMKAV